MMNQCELPCKSRARTCADSDFDIARYVTNAATAVNAAVKAGVAPSSHRNYAANDGNHWVSMTLASWTKPKGNV